MNYIQILNHLSEKKEKCLFSQSELNDIRRIAGSSDSGNKFHLLRIIQEYIEQEEVYRIVKFMAKDPCIIVYKMAIQVLGGNFRRDTYDFFLELAQEGPPKKRFFALYYLISLVYDMDVEEEKWIEEAEQWIKDVEDAVKGHGDRLTKFIMDASYFFSSWEEEYLKRIGKSLYDPSGFIRLWSVNLLEDVMDFLDPGDEEIEEIRQILYDKMQRKDKVRQIRILVDGAYCRIAREFDKNEFCERDFLEEFEAEEEYEARIKEKADPEDILSYAILLFYYPMRDIEKAIRLLEQYGRGDDVRLALLGCYLACYYRYEGKEEKGNPFLGSLMNGADEYDSQTKALVFMMKGVTLLLKGEQEEGMGFLERAVLEDPGCANIYKEIADFTPPYSKKHKAAERKFHSLQKKISLDELEKIPLKDRCKYEFFLEMEIKKNIRKPDGFENPL